MTTTTNGPSRPLSSIWSDAPPSSAPNNMQQGAGGGTNGGGGGGFYGTPEKPVSGNGNGERGRNVSGQLSGSGFEINSNSNLNVNGNLNHNQAFSPSPTRSKGFPSFAQSGFGHSQAQAQGQGQGGYLSATTTGTGTGGDASSATGMNIQRSRSPNRNLNMNMNAPGTGMGMVPNGRFLEINPNPGSSETGANSGPGVGMNMGYSQFGQTHQRIPTSPSSLGRTSDRVYGSAGSVDSVMGGNGVGLSSVGPAEGDGETELDISNSNGGNNGIDVSQARRSPRPESAFEGGRKLWNAGQTQGQGQGPAGGSILSPQVQGPGSLGGTPTRGVGGAGRPGVERSHSRFATAPAAGVALGQNAGMGAGASGPGGLGSGLGAGLDRPLSAMSTKGVSAGGGVAGVTDSSGRMEGQALIDLIARVARTEAAIADMSQQVASLNTIVKSLQISATQNGTVAANGLGSHSGSNSSSGGSTPSLFAAPPPQITRTSASNTAVPGLASLEGPPSAISTGALTAETNGSNSTITPTAGSSSSNPDVAALTHQIAALSASVAQLQRMQSTSVRQGMEKRMGQSGAASPEEKTGVPPAAGQSGTSNTPPGQNASATGAQQAAQTPSQGGHPQQQGYFPNMGGNVGRPQNARNQTGPAGALNSSIASALGSIGSRPRLHPGRAASSSVVPGAGSGNAGQGYQSMGNGGERLGVPTSGAAGGMSLGPMNMINQGAGGRVERDRLEAVTPGGMSREGGPGGMTVTKWEHLPLTPELQRQIVKYGIGPPNKIQARALPFMLRGSDIIAQAPPTQERIITYVIPVVQLVLSLGVQHQPTYKGPCAIIVTTTVDQATQAHKLIRDIGAPLGVRTGLAVGASGADISADLANWHRNAVHVLVGTPARLNDVMVKHASNGGLPGGEVRMLVLDEVDQLIARNLYENVTSICRVLPAPRSRNPTAAGNGIIGTPGPMQSPGITSPFDLGMSSPFNPASTMPFPSASNARFNNSNNNNNAGNASMALGSNPERQTCIFSNTIPTDVINFSQSIQVREPVRVLVRREGGTNTSNESTSAGNLRHYYLYLALASGAANRNEAAAAGPGTIGSGRAAGNQNTEVNQAKEFKLEALADLLLEYPLWQAIIHVGAQSTLDAVVGKLNSRQMENLSLSPDMSSQAKQAVYTKWRASAQSGRGARFLVAFDTIVKPPEVVAAPLVVNFDLPRSVEGYAQRVSAANQADVSRNDRNRNGPTPSSIVLNFIQAAGGDVEMLRSTECAYRFKCSEIPASFRDLF